MKGFPPTFRIETFRTDAIQHKQNEYMMDQMAKLELIRKRIVEEVTKAAEDGEREYIIHHLEDIDAEMKIKLAGELLERFKGHIYYRWVVVYADVDEFVLMESPRASLAYKIVF